jgi:nucleoside-diphosphate kinase
MTKKIFACLLTTMALQIVLQAQIDVQVKQVPNDEVHISQPRVSQSNTQVTQNTPQNAVEQTLSIIKPDAVQSNHIGNIIARLEKSGLRIAAIKMVQLSKDQAGKFYQVHRERPFYPALVDFMSSGPVVVMVLEGQNAVAKNREVMGATDPQKANQGTIRADFAESVTRNAVHGSDAAQTAKDEIDFFFKANELNKRY